MFEVISENTVWFLLLILTIILFLVATIFAEEAKTLFSTKKILCLVVILPLLALFSVIFSISLPPEGEFYSYSLIVITSFINAFFYGLMTKTILQVVGREEKGIVESIRSANRWFVMSIIGYCLGIGGNFLIYFYLLPSWERPQRIFLCIIWTALTFALYPLLIADEGNPFLAVGRAFKKTLFSFHHWFYLFLITLFVSGEFLQLFPSSSVRVSWSGGYTFQPIWFDVMTKSADLSPTTVTCIYIVVLFVCSVIATLVKIKLTKILFDLGCISSKLKD